MIPDLLTHVTVDDVIRAGACAKETARVAEGVAPGETLVCVDDVWEKLDAEEELPHLMRAAGRSGSGSGDGYGDGYGSGDGYGDGSGYGSGYGSTQPT